MLANANYISVRQVRYWNSRISCTVFYAIPDRILLFIFRLYCIVYTTTYVVLEN